MRGSHAGYMLYGYNGWAAVSDTMRERLQRVAIVYVCDGELFIQHNDGQVNGCQWLNSTGEPQVISTALTLIPNTMSVHVPVRVHVNMLHNSRAGLLPFTFPQNHRLYSSAF